MKNAFFAGILCALASISCGGGDGDGAPGSMCASSASASYASCVGSYIDNACPAGGCGFGDLAVRTYDAWRAEILALSGISPGALDKRVAISTVEVEPGPVVRIAYVIVLDWVRARKAVLIDFTAASAPASDAEIASAVDKAIVHGEWERLGGIATVAPEIDVRAAFDACRCAMVLDWCSIDYAPGGGPLEARGSLFPSDGASASAPAASDTCVEARVDVVTAELVACEDVACPAEY